MKNIFNKNTEEEVQPGSISPEINSEENATVVEEVQVEEKNNSSKIKQSTTSKSWFSWMKKSKQENVELVEKPLFKRDTDTSGKYSDLNIIDLVNIDQSYDNGKTVIFQDFNMSVKDIIGQGQFTSILGKSGCGKSTILRYISGLQKPSSGDVYVYGKQLTPKDRIPMVFQHYTSFEWKSVLENVALPLILNGVSKKVAFEKAMHMIEIVGLQGHEHKFAKYPTLSGGQLQRVAIARNLISNPQILLMDEPYNALDYKNRTDMQLFLRGIFEHAELDPTVLFVTHDITEAVFLSTDIIILDSNPGRIKHHIKVDLPNKRDISLQDSQNFVEQVREVRSLMRKL
ncbi:MAG: ABC transporter ATP-binding protein [Candidatus Absconditicoccaceae bacterium]